MRVTVVFGVMVAAALLMGGLLGSPVRAEEPVSVEVVGLIPRADGSDRTIFVGVRFIIAPGWHLYWKNPGDLGLPTKVAFELPPGYSAEPVQWPRPFRFSPPGEAKMYGYEGEVVLVSRITPPENYRLGAPVEVTVRTSWLGCTPKSCVRDAKDLRELLSLEGSKPVAFFEDWIRQVPLPASRHPAVRAVAARGDGGLEVLWQEKVSEVEVVLEQALPTSGWKVAESAQTVDERGAVTTVSAIPGEGPDPRPIPVLILFRRAGGAADGIAATIPSKRDDVSPQTLGQAPAAHSATANGNEQVVQP